jgi:hypothetical protein
MTHRATSYRNTTRRPWPGICVCAVWLALVPTSGQAQNDYESISALWQQSISATRLAGYKASERLIISNIWTGMLGRDAIVKHSLRVKVDTWAKRFTIEYVSDKRHRETLAVTLYKTTNPREMSAHFEHVVYEDGAVKLRFCGITRLQRI